MVTGSDGREGWAAVWLEWSRSGGRSARAPNSGLAQSGVKGARHGRSGSGEALARS